MVPCAKARWMAARALYESDRPSLEQIAVVAGWRLATVQSRAGRDGWQRSDPPKDPGGRVARVIDGLLGEIEALGFGNGEGAIGLDKARIEAISALIRTLEKIADITRSNTEVNAKERQITRDADMAGFLRRIDERIVELAAGHAKELVRKESSGRKASADS
jgi:hypothetical protein